MKNSLNLHQTIQKLERKPFALKLIGPRIELVRPSPNWSKQVWEYIQRDHRLGGKNYSWVSSLEDVEKYITNEAEQDMAGIDYLIIKQDKAIGSFHVHSISYSDHKAEVGYGVEKVAERNGFSIEGVLLQDRVENGQFRDSIIFGQLLKSN
jgi:RimJ/RimL family protein N-acetyltransferase